MEIRVERPFIYNREPAKVGDVLDTSIAFGREMIAVGKASPVGDAKATLTGPLDVANAGALVPGKGKKEATP